MHPALKPLSGIDDLDRALAATDERPLLLFKHSFSCGVSAEALGELVAHLNEGPLEASYAMVTVQTHREVSNAVAKRLGVRHESPQALLIRGGQVVWSASHFRVTAAAVEAAFRTLSPARRPMPTTRPIGN
jgi:bacillithiol system protein YtxJ